jgi:hypothetical protein
MTAKERADEKVIGQHAFMSAASLPRHIVSPREGYISPVLCESPSYGVLNPSPIRCWAILQHSCWRFEEFAIWPRRSLYGMEQLVIVLKRRRLWGTYKWTCDKSSPTLRCVVIPSSNSSRAFRCRRAVMVVGPRLNLERGFTLRRVSVYWSILSPFS